MKADPKNTAGRAFVRSLNILLKFARLYGYDHARTSEQLDVAWQELSAAIPYGSESGLLLGATGSQLLLDGVPLEGSPAEKQFSLLLSAAGLASIQFFPSVTQEELSKFVRAFPTGKAKPAELAAQLKAALVGAHGIRTNEICFVATDSRLKEASVAAQLAVATLGEDQDQFKQWLNDPQKLLELIAAAEGSKSGTPGEGAGRGVGSGSGSGIEPGGGLGPGPGGGTNFAGTSPGSGSSGSGTSGAVGASSRGTGPSVASYGGGGAGTYAAPGSGATGLLGVLRQERVASGPFHGRSGSAIPTEEEIFGILSALTSFGKVGAGGGDGMAAAAAFHEQVSALPGGGQATLKEAIAALAAQAPEGKPDESVLVKLAEHLAIKYALEKYERGEVKVNAVRQMLDRMNQEIDNLRKILGAHEDKMSEAGMLVESHREILDRQFWAAVPESGKQAVLLSNDAWCIPPRNVQSYVASLIEKGDVAQAVSILQNYAACAESDESEARKKTAVGLAEMAALYGKADKKLLSEALRHLGLRLSVEQDADLQSLVSAAFVRLSQETATTRYYTGMEQALELISGVETQRPGIARSLRGKMGIEDRVPEFLEEALRARQAAAGLTNVLKLLPQTAMQQLAARFNRCAMRDDAEQVASLSADIGEEGLQFLRSAIRGAAPAEAVESVGLLCKLDSRAAEVFLPSRVKDFPRSAQDRAVRQISGSSAHGRCRILLAVLNHVDPLVTPLVVDEIGITGEREGLGKLLTIVDGDLPPGSGQYLRVKAIEALGRIHAPESVATLQRVLEGKKVFGWAQPQELRIAAMQAIQKLDPEWAADFLPKSGLSAADMALPPLEVTPTCKFVRQRRHARVRLHKPVTAISTNLKENCRMEIKTASLSGGVASIDRHMHPGTPVQLRLQLGLRSLQATALLRDYRAQDMAFEIVDMNLEERTRYRLLLAESLPAGPSPQTEEHAVPETVNALK